MQLPELQYKTDFDMHLNDSETPIIETSRWS